jgi:hypothetical protein
VPVKRVGVFGSCLATARKLAREFRLFPRSVISPQIPASAADVIVNRSRAGERERIAGRLVRAV